MHNLFNSRFSAKPAHEQAQHSEEKCLCRTFWKISVDLGWPEETQRAVCEREREREKDTVSHTLPWWTCRLFTLWIDVTQSLIPVGYALPLPCSSSGCVLQQCKLRKVMQNQGNKCALFTSHPHQPPPRFSCHPPQALENQRLTHFQLSWLNPHSEPAGLGVRKPGRWSRWHCSLWASDKFHQLLRLWLLICRVNRAMTECLLGAKCLRLGYFSLLKSVFMQMRKYRGSQAK